MKLIFLTLLMFVSAAVWAEQPECALKIYAAPTQEIHQGIMDLYQIERGPGVGYVTLTCIDPVILQSRAMSERSLRVTQNDQIQNILLREFLDVNRYLYVGNFAYLSGQEIEFDYSALPEGMTEVQTLNHSATFYDR